MGNRVAIAEKVFWNYGLDVTTGGVKYRASMFIKTVLEAAFGLLNVTLSLISLINSFLFLSTGIFLSPGPFFRARLKTWSGSLISLQNLTEVLKTEETVRWCTCTWSSCVACELAHLWEFGENYFGGGADIQRGKTHSGQPAKFFPELTKVSLLDKLRREDTPSEHVSHVPYMKWLLRMSFIAGSRAFIWRQSEELTQKQKFGFG